MSTAKTLTPQVLWAQRSSETDADENYLLITISVPDCENPSVKIESDSLDFSSKSKGHVGDEATHQYHLHIDFFKEITPDKTLHKIANGQHYFLKIYKKELGLEYWPRLTKEKVKYPYIKTDFNKWVDEDDQQDAPPPAGFDMNDMMMNGNPDMEALKQQLAQGAGGMGAGGMGGAGGAPPAGFDMNAMMNGNPDMEALKQQLGASGMDLGAAGFPEEIGDEADEEEVLEETEAGK